MVQYTLFREERESESDGASLLILPMLEHFCLYSKFVNRCEHTYFSQTHEPFRIVSFFRLTCGILLLFICKQFVNHCFCDLERVSQSQHKIEPLVGVLIPLVVTLPGYVVQVEE